MSFPCAAPTHSDETQGSFLVGLLAMKWIFSSLRAERSNPDHPGGQSAFALLLDCFVGLWPPRNEEGGSEFSMSCAHPWRRNPREFLGRPGELDNKLAGGGKGLLHARSRMPGPLKPGKPCTPAPNAPFRDAVSRAGGKSLNPGAIRWLISRLNPCQGWSEFQQSPIHSERWGRKPV